jgi:hypothetical protein
MRLQLVFLFAKGRESFACARCGNTTVCQRLTYSQIYDSPSLPESEAVFAITDGGVSDGKE